MPEHRPIPPISKIRSPDAHREISVERGHDVRDFTLFAFGGGGPLHAVALARELRMKRVIIPPEPGNFSAVGMLLADPRTDEVHTFRADLTPDFGPALSERLDQMAILASTRLTVDFGARDMAFEYQMEARLKGQRHSVKVRFDKDASIAVIADLFYRTYAATFGLTVNGQAIELISLRVSASERTEKPALDSFHRIHPDAKPIPTGQRGVYHFDAGRLVTTPIYGRYDLPIGHHLQGPAVIEEFGSTTVIGPNESVTVGQFGEMVIDLNDHTSPKQTCFTVAKGETS